MSDIPPMPPLSPWQQSIWDSKKRNWLLYAGRRKGKSRVCWQKGVQFCLNGMITDWFCANRLLADENWKDVVEFCRPFASSVNEVNQGTMTFVHPEKGIGRFRRKSSYLTSAGRAGSVHFLILDEGQLLGRKLFVRSRPGLLTTHGRTAITLTPPEDPEEYHRSQWLKEILDATDDNGNCSLPGWNRWLVTKAPTLPEDIAFVMQQDDLALGIKHQWRYYINQATDSMAEDLEYMGPHDYNREYNLLWALDTETLVYDDYRDGFHRKEEYEYDPSLDVFWCADRGEGVGYSVILFFQRRVVKTIGDIPIYCYRFFDEVSTRRLMTEDELYSLALMRSELQGYKLPVRVYYDPRAPGLGLAAQQINLSSYSCNVGIEDGIRVNRRLLANNLFELHPRCTLLANNLVSYRRDAKGYPVDADNDALDACRYGTSMSEKLDGRLNSVIAENRQVISRLGVNTESVMLLRL